MMMSHRSFLCLAIVASVHGRFRGGDSLQPYFFETMTTATPPMRTDGCPWENDPVTCRFPPTTTTTSSASSSSSSEEDEEPGPSRPRTYSSMCFASRAGYGVEHCYSRDRGAGNNDASSNNSNHVLLKCLSVTDVVCREGGDDEPHKFANLCLAQVGGYRGKDCAASISTNERRRLLRHPRNLQTDHVYCPEWYRPVYCTLSAIMFPSDCEAGVAGYSLHDCTLPDGGPDSTCPETGRGTVGPISCNGTQYDSICLASAASYAPSVDCILLDNSTVQTTSIVRKCATSGKVRCGRRQRAFDNLCLARKAGFTRKKCQSI